MRKDRRDNFSIKVVKADKTTTTPVANTVYVYSVTVFVANAGTTWTLAIQDKDPAGATLIYNPGNVTVSTAPVVVLEKTFPLKMVGGIDIITGGTTAGSLTVWLNYSQD